MACKIVTFDKPSKELTLRDAIHKYVDIIPIKVLDKKVDDLMLIFQVDGEVHHITLYEDSDLEYVGLLELIKSIILMPYGLTFEE